MKKGLFFAALPDELPFFRCPLATVELDELVMNLLPEGKKVCLTFSILINHLLQLTLSMNNQNLFLICCREKLQKLFTSKAVVVPYLYHSRLLGYVTQDKG